MTVARTTLAPMERAAILHARRRSAARWMSRIAAWPHRQRAELSDGSTKEKICDSPSRNIQIDVYMYGMEFKPISSCMCV